LTIIAFIVTGCTTLRPISQSQNEVQKPISYKDIIRSGDKVQITTADGKEYTFKVTSVEDGFIKGNDTEIVVKDILSIKKAEISKGKTWALIGTTIGVALLGLILYGVSHLSPNWQ
jgi:hypothetical protein